MVILKFKKMWVKLWSGSLLPDEIVPAVHTLSGALYSNINLLGAVRRPIQNRLTDKRLPFAVHVSVVSFI
jgi:hypothetical protein